MRILVVGALSWNPERLLSLVERGHQLWGLWSRSMAWDQGPYPAVEHAVRRFTLQDAPSTIRDRQIGCVYSLFQVYRPSLWAPAAAGVEHDVWTLLRQLLLERQRGTFDAPIVRHWGFDVHELDLDVVRVLDAHIFCNRQKLDYWAAPVREGGCGLDVLGGRDAVVAFLDGDRPKREFMHDGFSRRLSESDGEIHTVCVGRPFNLDFAAAAAHGIHVHVYGNGFDEVLATIARGVTLRRAGRSDLGRYVHVHTSLQGGDTWDEVRRTKSRWVEEFSQYDAGWSYIGNPLAWPALDDRAAIPNRVSTYLLAGLPVITDRRPGCYRYDELERLGVGVELDGSGYAGLRSRLEAERRTRDRHARAVAAREDYSFDATIDSLLGVFERARDRYFARSHAERTAFAGGLAPNPVPVAPWRHPRTVAGRMHRAWLGRRRVLSAVSTRLLARALGDGTE
jgi:hypothetical protein